MEMKRWIEDNKGSENERERMEGHGDKDVPRVRKSEARKCRVLGTETKQIGNWNSWLLFLIVGQDWKKGAKVEKTKAGQTETRTVLLIFQLSVICFNIPLLFCGPANQ